MKYGYSYDFPIGKLMIVEENQMITHVSFETRNDVLIEETDLIKECKKQLDQYFNKQRTIFDLPLNPQGTPFQKKCWLALTKIPYGKTISYKQQAINIGNPKAIRAVGGANHYNPIAIIIPCHRVIGANQKLVGYAGGLNTKQYLLDLEKDA